VAAVYRSHARRVPALGLPLTLAVVVMSSAILATILNHRHDAVPAPATAVESSPSAMF
jgi:hypothetical protein